MTDNRETQCTATTKAGRRCLNPAIWNVPLCVRHSRERQNRGESQRWSRAAEALAERRLSAEDSAQVRDETAAAISEAVQRGLRMKSAPDNVIPFRKRRRS